MSFSGRNVRKARSRDHRQRTVIPPAEAEHGEVLAMLHRLIIQARAMFLQSIPASAMREAPRGARAAAMNAGLSMTAKQISGSRLGALLTPPSSRSPRSRPSHQGQ